MTEDFTPSPARPEKSKYRRGPIAVIVLLLAAVAAVLFLTLGDATLVFYEVDEVVERREELVDKRFRVVGTPLPGIVETTIGVSGRLHILRSGNLCRCSARWRSC